jgi:hypothetical protein
MTATGIAVGKAPLAPQEAELLNHGNAVIPAWSACHRESSDIVENCYTFQKSTTVLFKVYWLRPSPSIHRRHR